VARFGHTLLWMQGRLTHLRPKGCNFIFKRIAYACKMRRAGMGYGCQKKSVFPTQVRCDIGICPGETPGQGMCHGPSPNGGGMSMWQLSYGGGMSMWQLSYGGGMCFPKPANHALELPKIGLCIGSKKMHGSITFRIQVYGDCPCLPGILHL